MGDIDKSYFKEQSYIVINHMTIKYMRVELTNRLCLVHAKSKNHCSITYGVKQFMLLCHGPTCSH